MVTSTSTETEIHSNTIPYLAQISIPKAPLVEDPLLAQMQLNGGLMTQVYAIKSMFGTMTTMTYTGLTLTPAIHQVLNDYLAMQAAIRNEKSKHVVYAAFPDIREMKTRVYWGVFSWSLPQQKQRFLLKQSIVRLNENISSPGDIVRDYLDFYHPKPLRCIGKEARAYEQHKSAPLYFHPFTIREGTYIDIESTYFSILKLIGWNINYLPGEWLIPGRAPLDFPLPSHKGARNYLVSIGLPRPMLVWNGITFLEQKGKNTHINRGLWLAVMDILHSIATIAVSLGAQYVHTDGYILPTKNAPILIRAIKEWGLNARVLGEGETYVFGIGNYSVGDKRSKSFDPARVGMPLNHINETPRRWLQKQVQKIATNRIAEHLYNTWNID